MRLILAASFLFLLSSAAEAQLISLQQMIDGAIARCVADRPGQPDAPRFCQCWVHRWVGLWDAYDIAVWTKAGIATPHMARMESVAAAECKNP